MVNPVTLPGNILTPAGSDFETGTLTWQAFSNATSVAISTAQAFTGTHSLTWAAVASGSNASVELSSVINAAPGMPYIASCQVYLPAGSYAAMQFNILASGTWTTYQGEAVQAPAGGGWVPCSMTIVTPAGTTGIEPAIAATPLAAGTVFYADMVYMAQSATQVLVDWTTPAFTATQPAYPSFTDITGFINVTTAPITMTHGRQDATSEVQPGSLTFTVDNTSGWFTQGGTTPWSGVTLGARIQWNQAYWNGTGYNGFVTRFDGAINEFDYTIAPAGPSYTMAQVIATDVIGYLSQSRTLNSWVVETALLDGPDFLWPLSEQSDSLIGREIANNGPSATRAFQGNQNAGGSFGGTVNAVETMANASGVLKGPYTSPITGWGQSSLPLVTSGAAGNGAEPLVINLPKNYAPSSNWSLEWWATLDPSQPNAWNSATNTSRQSLISISNETRIYTVQGIAATSPNASMNIITYSTNNPWLNQWTNTGSSGSSSAIFNAAVPLANHFVLTNTSAGMLTLWMDGNAIASTTPSDFASLKGGGGLNTITIGSCPQTLYPSGNGFAGNIAAVAIYDYVLNSTQIVNHCSRGQYGMYGTNTGAMINQLSEYVGLPSFWVDSNLASRGLSTVDYVAINGQNALTTMQYAEQVEQGLLYAPSSGKLTLASRAARMAMGSADYTLPIGSFTADLGATVTNQYLQTAATFAGNGSSVIGTADSGDESRLGSYTPNGSTASPVTLPILTVAPKNPTPGQAIPYAQDLASWNVASNDSAPFKAKNLTFDIYTQHVPTDKEFLAPSTIALFDVNTVLGLSTSEVLPTLPSTAGGMLDMVVEGITETLQLGVHEIQVYTSPAANWRCWIPGDATWGVLGETTVLGISQEPNNKSANVAFNSWDPGLPYLAPTFSATMNEGEGSTPFVGMSDLRGIVTNQQTAQTPPIFSGGQSWASGASPWTIPATTVEVFPSMTALDTWNMATGQINPTATGSGLAQGGWVAPLGGVYEISGYVNWTASTSGATGTAYFTYLSVTDYSTGSANTWDPGFAVSWGIELNGIVSGATASTGNYPSAGAIQCRVYVPAGAIISFQAYQHTTAALTAGGIHLSARYMGQSTTFIP